MSVTVSVVCFIIVSSKRKKIEKSKVYVNLSEEIISADDGK